MANINKRFGDLSLSANIGGSFTQTYYDERGFQGGLKDMSNVFSLYNMTTTLDKDTYPIESGYKQRTNSIFASAEIGWKSMLYMTLTGRNDWDSALINTEQSSFFYPSIGTFRSYFRNGKITQSYYLFESTRLICFSRCSYS